MHTEVSLDPHWRLRECGIDVATLELAVDNDVAASLLVQARRVVFNGFQRIDDDRQRLEFDVDHFERVFGKVAALRHDADHRFTDVAHFAARKRQDRRGVIAFHARRR